MKETIEINFKYKGKNHNIKCDKTTKFEEICKNFAKQNSLDMDSLLFIHDETEINLKLDIFIEEQFIKEINAKSKKKRKIEILVYDKAPIQIKFCSQNTIVLPCKKTDKISDYLLNYASMTKVEITQLMFLHGGDFLNYKEDKTVFEVMNEQDKEENIISISVTDENQNSISAVPTFKENIDPIPDQPVILVINENIRDELINNENERDRRPERPEPLEPLFYQKKNFYFKNSIILGIQYIFILLFSSLGFIFHLDDTLVNINVSIIMIFLLIILFFAFMSMVFSECIKDYKKSKYMILFHIFYPFIVVYLSFILSKYFDYKYIIIGLVTFFIEILSLGIYVNICKKYNLIYFCLFSSLLSLIIFVPCLLFWLNILNDIELEIKSLLPIIFLVSFWFFSISYYLLWIHISLKSCELDDYFYSSVIYDYGIILGLVYLIIFPIKYIFKFLDNHYYMKESWIDVFITLLKQYIIIITAVWVGFSLGLTQSIKNDSTIFKWLIWTPSISVILLYIVYIIIMYAKEPETKGWYFYHVIYVPIMILYYYAFSYFTEEKYILCFLFFIFFDLLSIIFVMYFFQVKKMWFLLIPCLLSTIIEIILFHFFWLNDKSSLVYIILLAFFIIAYLMGFYCFLEKDGGCERSIDKIAFVMFLDYGFFSLIFLPFGIIYCCCKCFCNDC